MAFGGAEPNGNRLDHLAGIDQGRHRDKFVSRMHRRADSVFHERSFERLVWRLDEARDFGVSGDDALGGELLQGLEPPPAGGDGVEAFLVGRGVNHQVLL
jgi:hypothetical protein